MMVKFFSRLNEIIWRGAIQCGVIYGGEEPRTQPKPPTPPAPEDLFNMAVEAIRKHSLTSVEEMERTGDFNNTWKHLIEELIYAGAFSEEQSKVLQEVFSEVTHSVAISQARVAVTRILCDAADNPKAMGNVSVTGRAIGGHRPPYQNIAASIYSSKTWK